MDYIQLNIEFNTVDPYREVAMSLLADEGFESFVETNSGLESYIPINNYKESILEVLKPYNDYIDHLEAVKIKDQNWNAEWEKNFDPVFVDDLLVIKAPFHTQEFTQKMSITIQPQMSFGTGHHQTTWLASQRLFDLDLAEKTVLDMGTGTGVLAILAEKLGANKIYAPDIDEWSFNNAIENVALNNCSKVEVALGTDQLIQDKKEVFDVIIANINKNILIQQFPSYANSIKPNGVLLISGFFETDKDDLVQAAQTHGFEFNHMWTKEGWALIELAKTN